MLTNVKLYLCLVCHYKLEMTHRHVAEHNIIKKKRNKSAKTHQEYLRYTVVCKYDFDFHCFLFLIPAHEHTRLVAAAASLSKSNYLFNSFTGNTHQHLISSPWSTLPRVSPRLKRNAQKLNEKVIDRLQPKFCAPYLEIPMTSHTILEDPDIDARILRIFRTNLHYIFLPYLTF